jgi:lysine-specific demethylase 8
MVGRGGESGMRIVGRVERVGALRREEFEERFALPGRPVVIAGAIEHWPARQLWSPEQLGPRLGALKLRYKRSRSHVHPDFEAAQGEGANPAAAFATCEAPFGEFLQALQGPEASRWLFTGDEEPLLRARPGSGRQVSPALAPLLGDFELPPYFDAQRLYTVWTWFSAAGVRTWLHYDNNACHNLNAQIRGSKRCWLFPPAALERFYPFELDAAIPAHNCSRVHVERPDYGRFPRFREAECLEGELGEGDLLFLPAFWFHTFLHTGAWNANVNFWWRPQELALNPVSARWMWLKALATALSGQPSEGAGPGPDELARLPAAARAVLRRVDALVQAGEPI